MKSTGPTDTGPTDTSTERSATRDRADGTGPGGPQGRTTGGHRYRRRALSAVVGCVLAVALAAILFNHSSGSPARGATGAGTATQGTVGDLAPGIDQATASLMKLNVIPPAQAFPAPGMDGLVDQHGRPFSLSSLRGKVVVWSLNDDQCTDLCTLFAQDVIAADRDLGTAANDVVFVSVNANPFYPSPGAVLAWSQTNEVESLPNWLYLTGSPAQLEQTWRDFKVTVVQDRQERTVTHDASLQYIDPQGRMRALGFFDTGAISTSYYGHAMAQMADDLLPQADKAGRVGGPDVLAGPTLGATIGQSAPGFDLAPLTGSGGSMSLGAADTKPLVVNFWSSTCSVCIQEMPALQQTYQHFDGQLEVVGIDVADPRSSAASFASRLGVHYPLLADPDGTTAADYRVASLPVTLVVGPGRIILARHDGALTEPQLQAILEMDFPQLPQG